MSIYHIGDEPVLVVYYDEADTIPAELVAYLNSEINTCNIDPNNPYNPSLSISYVKPASVLEREKPEPHTMKSFYQSLNKPPKHASHSVKKVSNRS